LEWILLGLRILTTAILYAFLGVAFYIIWQELKQAEQERVQPANSSYQLRVVAVNGTGALAIGEILPLRSYMVLGSDGQTTISLPNAAVSAQHARLSYTHGVWWLENLSGATTLNETPLAQPVPLREGDVIGVGGVRFKLEKGNAYAFGTTR
jgi:hypothetical protein